MPENQNPQSGQTHSSAAGIKEQFSIEDTFPKFRVHGYAAHSPNHPLEPFHFERREPGVRVPYEGEAREQSAYAHHRGTAGQERGPESNATAGDLNSEATAIGAASSSGYSDAEENANMNETEYPPTFGDEGGGGWERARVETRKGTGRSRKSTQPKSGDSTRNRQAQPNDRSNVKH